MGDPVDELHSMVRTLESARLIEIDDDAIGLTPRGMFFADSVAGYLATPRVTQLVGRRDDNDATRHAMG